MESSLEKVKATACNNRSLSAFFALAICTLCLPPKSWISLANFARFHACMRIKICKSHIVKLIQRKYFFSLSCVGSSICLYLFILTRWRPQAFAGNTITKPVIRCLSAKIFSGNLGIACVAGAEREVWISGRPVRNVKGAKVPFPFRMPATPAGRALPQIFNASHSNCLKVISQITSGRFSFIN